MAFHDSPIPAPFPSHWTGEIFASVLRASLVMGSTCDSVQFPSDSGLRARNEEAQRRTEMKDDRHAC